MDFHL